MNPRQFALNNLLDQAAQAYQLNHRVRELSVPSSSEEFHAGSRMGEDVKQRRLRKLELTKTQLEENIARVAPAWIAFEAGDFDAVIRHLSGATDDEAAA